MENTLEANLSRSQLARARYVLYPFSDLVPNREEFVGGRISWRFDGMVFKDERIEFDDFAMAVQHVNRKLSRDMAGNGRDVRVCRLFRHGD